MGKRIFLFLLMILVFILSLNSYSSNSKDNSYTISNPATYEFTYAVEITNNGPGTVTKLYLWMPLAQTYEPYQFVEILSLTPEPFKIEKDKFENKIAQFQINENIGVNKKVKFEVKYKVQIYSISFKIQSSSFENYNAKSFLYKEYTKPEKYIESDSSKIKSKVEEIVGDNNDPYQAGKKIYEFVIHHLQYSGYSGPDKGALYAFEHREGDCTEYSDLFIALCRAKGIPANFIEGVVYNPGAREREQIVHDWAEIFIPEYGWIPVDATWGEDGKDYYGNMDNQHIVISKGRWLPSLEGYHYYYFYYYYEGGEPNIIHEDFFRIVEIEKEEEQVVEETKEETVEEETEKALWIWIIFVILLVSGVFFLLKKRKKAEFLFCPNCGKPCGEEDLFCQNCGNRLR